MRKKCILHTRIVCTGLLCKNYMIMQIDAYVYILQKKEFKLTMQELHDYDGVNSGKKNCFACLRALFARVEDNSAKWTG